MNLLTASLTILGLSASALASQSKTGADGYPDTLTKDIRFDQWSQKEIMEMWQEIGRRHRDGRGRSDVVYDENDHPRHGRWGNSRRSRGDRRGGDERRWNDNGSERRRDRDGNGRDGNGNNNPPPYPPTIPNPPHVAPPQYPPTAPSYPDQKNERDTIGSIVYPVPVITTFLPPIPIIIERPVMMPSIIEPYPEVVESEAYYGSSSVVTPTGSYGPTSSVYGPTTMHSSSVYVPTTSMYSSHSAVIPMSKKQIIYATNSTTSYYSTRIITEAEATVTTKVTGRYRAMSNAANNLAGSVSFTIVLLSSIFLIALV